MTNKLESLIDEFVISRGLDNEVMRDVVSSILIYGTPALTKEAKRYFHTKKLKIPIEIVTEEEAKERQGIGYFLPGQKKPYHFRVYQKDLKRYSSQK